MKNIYSLPGSGLNGLDEILTGILPGDNIVWQVDSIEDYIPFVHPFCRKSENDQRPLIYFRFAEHPAILPEGTSAEIHLLHPESGFETFISEIFDVIERVGTGGCYVFDCL
ncbi:MAG: pyruvate, phosphate dikinase, partial [Candidatus Aureabacteria bacterium]|nr:pyruvate, phosphate dikinase [Candidatus Auribacterota bacterium]